MKFRFRLAPALRIIELEENKKKMEIARIYGNLNSLEVRRDQLSLNVHHLLSSGIGNETSSLWLAYRSNKIEADRAESQVLERKITDQKELLHNKQGELAVIMMKRRAFERKKESELRIFNMGEGRKEQKRLDDNHQILRLLRKVSS